MIKYECNEDMVKIDIKGNLVTLASDTLRMIHHIWNSLEEPFKSEYKMLMTKAIKDAFKTEEEMKTETKEMMMGKAKEMKEMLDAMDFIKTLLDLKGDNDLINELKKLKEKENE